MVQRLVQAVARALAALNRIDSDDEFSPDDDFDLYDELELD